MMASGFLRWSFLAVLSLFVVVGLSSCSKKDVKQDEAGFQTGGGEGAAGGTGTTGAGEAGRTSDDLKTVHFAYDSYKLTGESRNILKNSAKWMKDNPSATIQVEGHCDERGTTEYNLALGERRANAAKDYLVKLGVDAARVSIISYGEERPVDPGHDEGAWAKNRRDEFVILSK